MTRHGMVHNKASTAFLGDKRMSLFYENPEGEAEIRTTLERELRFQKQPVFRSVYAAVFPLPLKLQIKGFIHIQTSTET